MSVQNDFPTMTARTHIETLPQSASAHGTHFKDFLGEKATAFDSSPNKRSASGVANSDADRNDNERNFSLGSFDARSSV